MAEKKGCVVFVVSVCEILLRFGPCRDVEKNADKRSHAWPRAKLIFAVSLFFYTFAVLPQPTTLDLTPTV